MQKVNDDRITMKNKPEEPFTMFCPQCGKTYHIKVTVANPVCKKCNPGRLDFEKKIKTIDKEW